jgi:hypothetical protein
VSVLNNSGSPFYDLFSGLIAYRDNASDMGGTFAALQLRDSTQVALMSDANPAADLPPLDMWDAYQTLDANGTVFLFSASLATGEAVEIFTELELLRHPVPLPAGTWLLASALGVENQAANGRVNPGSGVGPVEDYLDVDDRRAVDGLDRSDPQARSGDLANDDAMQAERIGPVRRSRGEDAGEGCRLIAAWMDLEYGPIGAMKPGDHDDFVARGEAVQRTSEFRLHLEPGVGRALRSLSRRIAERSQRRSNVPDRLQREVLTCSAHVRLTCPTT